LTPRARGYGGRRCRRAQIGGAHGSTRGRNEVRREADERDADGGGEQIAEALTTAQRFLTAAYLTFDGGSASRRHMIDRKLLHEQTHGLVGIEPHFLRICAYERT